MNRFDNSWGRLVIVAALLLSTETLMYRWGRAENPPPRRKFESFPVNVGGWTGTDVPIPPDIREVLGEGDFLTRVYIRNPEEPGISLFLAYFRSQRTGSTVHSPQQCLPGAGWTPIEHTYLNLTSPSGLTPYVNRYVIAKGLDRQLVIYWYESHGRIVASEYEAKFYLILGSIRGNRSDGALVRLITPLTDTEKPGAAQERATEFAEATLPLLNDYIPQ